MMQKKLLALVLLVIGALGLLYGGLNRDPQPNAEVAVVRGSDVEQTANFPMWAGISALLLSGFLITYRARRR
jgi:LPXTG-motif cell wall-anchored protein